MPETIIIITGIVIAILLFGGWLDIAYLGIMVRMWGFGRPRAVPRQSEKPVCHHRFGKMGPLVGWIFSPWEVIVTKRRLMVNYRNAFTRLDIPISAIKSVGLRRKPWPLSDDIIISYSDSGTPKRYLLSGNARVISAALSKVGASSGL